MDLQQQIDRSFGSGPEHRGLDGILTAGRRARTRRRAAIGAAGLITAAIVVGLGWMALPDDDLSRKDVVGEPAASETPSRAWYGDEPAWHDDQGRLHIADGATVTERVENPLGHIPPSTSVALVLEYDGKTRWMLLEWAVNGEFSTASATPGTDSADGFTTFGEWLEGQLSLSESQPRPANHLVELGADGRLRPQPGVEIIDQRIGLPLWYDRPRPGEQPPSRMAVARVTKDGEITFVMARRTRSVGIDYYAYEPGQDYGFHFGTVGPDLDSFVEFLNRYWGAA